MIETSEQTNNVWSKIFKVQEKNLSVVKSTPNAAFKQNGKVSKYADIIERLEKATGPDDALDFEIAMACNIDIRRCCGQGRPVSSDGITITGEECCDDPSWVPDQYTASLEAALEYIVPPKAGINLQGNGDVWYAVVAGQYSKACKTPALALCIAALRARSLPAI